MNEMTLSDDVVKKTFMYFAYGSNLLKKRIHIQNPTAVRSGFGKLKNYKLDFYHYAARWAGAPATIISSLGDEVWGAVWEIDMKNLADLDRQEGVHNKVYKPLIMDIEKPNGDIISCRVYQLVNNPSKLTTHIVPFERKPSYTYIRTIIAGAVESGLPDDYVCFLKSISHNGNTGDPQLLMALEKTDDNEKIC